MKILVSGGAGYIGSHTSIELLNNGHELVIADDFSNSSESVLDYIKKLSNKDFKFYKVDIANESEIEKIFIENKLDGVIHFAAFKAVGESVEKPISYYQNNLFSTILLAKMCVKYNVSKFVYSSSATVYGEVAPPMHEEIPTQQATNPYGQSKVICERILKDTVHAYPDFQVTLLRYFNPIGAHKSGLIGDNPNGIPNNLSPYILKVISGELPHLNVFGDDYNTIDGTGERDYIHVVDLAIAHVKAIENMISNINIYNVGTGKGTTVLQLLKSYEKAIGREIPYIIKPRRAGDIDSSYADCSKIEKELGWIATHSSADEMCKDSINFVMHNQK